MKFIDKLTSSLSFPITTEVAYVWDGTSTIGVLKAQNGTNFNDSKVIPFQLMVFTTDIEAVRGELTNFIAENHNKNIIDGFNYIKQYYYTPIVPTTLTPTGNQLTNLVILTGTLIISENVSSFQKVDFDGEEIKKSNITIAYATQNEANVRINSTSNAVASTVIKAGTLTFQLTFINKANLTGSLLKNIRLGLIPINSIHTLNLTTTDNDTVELYNVKVASYSISEDDNGLPITVLTLSKA